MIEAAGANLLYVPPYSPPRATPPCFAGRGPWLASPDFNPIENAFAKLEALLREAAIRTVSDLWNTIVRLIDTFTPADCANLFAAARYDAT